jgi:polyhydroxybutyrate depolymerase
MSDPVLQFRNAVLVIAALVIAGCATPRDQEPADGDQPGELLHAGLQRRFFVHVPPGYDPAQPAPLVLALHGGRGSGRDAARLSGLSAQADRGGFLIAYPDGVDGHWNDGRDVERYRAQREQVDDVDFLVTLIDHLAGRYAVDRTRVYVTGASNGALMANRLACEHAERFAAIAPVIGSMAAGVARRCAPTRAMPVLLINGTDDRLVPWNGEAVRFAGRDLGRILPLPELVRFWVRHNGCAPVPEITPLPDVDPDDGTRVVLQRYNGCRDGASVLLYEVQGGGHTWPRGVQYLPQWLIGRTSRDLDANAAIWAFFASHPRQP